MKRWKWLHFLSYFYPKYVSFACLSLEICQWQAVSDSLFVGVGEGSQGGPKPRWHSTAGFPKATCPVIILLTRSEIDKALCILPRGPLPCSHTHLSVSTHTCKHPHSNTEIYTKAHTEPDAHTFSGATYLCSGFAGLMWQQQQMQGLCSIHHILSLSQCAKWFY